MLENNLMLPPCPDGETLLSDFGSWQLGLVLLQERG